MNPQIFVSLLETIVLRALFRDFHHFIGIDNSKFIGSLFNGSDDGTSPCRNGQEADMASGACMEPRRTILWQAWRRATATILVLPGACLVPQQQASEHRRGFPASFPLR